MLSHEQKTFSSFQKIIKASKKTVRTDKNSTNERKKIKITINIKKKWIWTLIDNASNINYMNSCLWKELKIKKTKKNNHWLLKMQNKMK